MANRREKAQTSNTGSRGGRAENYLRGKAALRRTLDHSL